MHFPTMFLFLTFRQWRNEGQSHGFSQKLGPIFRSNSLGMKSWQWNTPQNTDQQHTTDNQILELDESHEYNWITHMCFILFELNVYFFSLVFNSERHLWIIHPMGMNFSWRVWLERCLCSTWDYGGKWGSYRVWDQGDSSSPAKFWRRTLRPSNQAHRGNVPISPLQMKSGEYWIIDLFSLNEKNTLLENHPKRLI